MVIHIQGNINSILGSLNIITSASFVNLLKVMNEFNDDQKKIFLKFVTGAERLPFGGIHNNSMTII